MAEVFSREVEAEYAALASRLERFDWLESTLSSAGRAMLADVLDVCETLRIDDPCESNMVAAINDLEAHVARLEARERAIDIELSSLQHAHVGGSSKDAPLEVPGDDAVDEAARSAELLAAKVAKLKAKHAKYLAVGEEHQATLVQSGFRPGDDDHASLVAAGARVKELEAQEKALELELKEYNGLPPDPRQAKAKLMQAQELLSLRTHEFDELLQRQMG